MASRFLNWLFLEVTIQGVVMINRKTTSAPVGVQQRLIVLTMTTVVFALSSCKKMDATYRDYVAGGEVVYVSKADSVAMHSGNNRMLLTWVRGANPKVAGIRVFNDDGE